MHTRVQRVCVGERVRASQCQPVQQLLYHLQERRCILGISACVLGLGSVLVGANWPRSSSTQHAHVDTKHYRAVGLVQATATQLTDVSTPAG